MGKWCSHLRRPEIRTASMTQLDWGLFQASMGYCWRYRIPERSSFGGGDSLSSGTKTAILQQVSPHYLWVRCFQDRSQEPGDMTRTGIPAPPAMIDADLRDPPERVIGDLKFVPRPCTKRRRCLRVKPLKTNGCMTCPQVSANRANRLGTMIW